MSNVKVFWDPMGFELDSLGKKQYLRAADGDTPFVSMSIRMLSIDTPETHYPDHRGPSAQDEHLTQLADWIQEKKAPITDGLAEYLYPKLATGKAGTLQEQQGHHAADTFKELLKEKLTMSDGTKRNVFLRTADQQFDGYGRLLAYAAPYYSREELSLMSRKERATFNLLMVASGWAASFPIYPSIPRHSDLTLLHEVAKDAYDHKKGAWADSMMLTGYEYRMCVKLYAITKNVVSGRHLSSKEKDGWISRFCMDMTTREIFYPQDYYRVEPYNRIFIWPDDVSKAVGGMNLSPPE